MESPSFSFALIYEIEKKKHEPFYTYVYVNT
jgi:hypothetical protein